MSQQKKTRCTIALTSKAHFRDAVPDADTLMDTTKCLKNEETGVLNEVLQTGNQKEVIHKNLEGKEKLLLLFCRHKGCRQKKNKEMATQSFPIVNGSGSAAQNKKNENLNME